jgi:glycosyltransferase involved in cell wall biosynthesis
VRILHLDTGLAWRGGQQQGYLLHRELVGQGVESRMLARGELLARCLREGLPAETLPGRRPWDPRVMARVLRLTASARGPAGPGVATVVLHAHDGHAEVLGAVVRALRPGARLVCHRRVSYPPGRGPLSRWKRSRADAWIAVSAEVAQVLRAAGVAGERIRVVHSALDAEAFRTAAAAADRVALRASLGIGETAPIVGFSAAFSPQKGHALLVEAAPGVLRKVPDAVFLLPGEGDLLAPLRARVDSLGLCGAFRFPGFRRDVAALTGLFTVGVVPSVDGEGSSASIKEPMALGVPVVVSDLAGNLEVVGDAGLTFANRDVGGLTAALVSLLQDPTLCAELGRRGRRRADAFTPSAMAGGALAAYRELDG